MRDAQPEAPPAKEEQAELLRAAALEAPRSLPVRVEQVEQLRAAALEAPRSLPVRVEQVEQLQAAVQPASLPVESVSVESALQAPEKEQTEPAAGTAGSASQKMLSERRYRATDQRTKSPDPQKNYRRKKEIELKRSFDYASAPQRKLSNKIKIKVFSVPCQETPDSHMKGSASEFVTL